MKSCGKKWRGSGVIFFIIFFFFFLSQQAPPLRERELDRERGGEREREPPASTFYAKGKDLLGKSP
jgi:hypothetical protein